MSERVENSGRKAHWEKIYQSRALEEVSWYQPRPETSLRFLEALGLPLAAKIIDIGGGDSLLVDHLLELGYHNLSVLDISEAALERARRRLGARAEKVNWIAADATCFQPAEKYDCWHDRAAFHFLSKEEEITSYIRTAAGCLKPGGALVAGTFSEQGPDKCSGLPASRYSEPSLASRFEAFFEKVECRHASHVTPSGTVQDFVFCGFRRKALSAS